MDASSPCWKDDIQSDSDKQLSRKLKNQEARRDDGENPGQISTLPRSTVPGHQKILSGSLIQENLLSPKKIISDGDRYFTLHL